jgi:site-specific recombinase XerC
MGKKTKKADAARAEATTTTETPIESQVEAAIEQAVATTEPAPEVKAPKKGRRAVGHVPPPMTLMDLAYAYFAHMEEAGNSEGTIASYKMEYRTAMAELGEKTPLADLTPEKIEAYFKSKRVTKLRSGKNKSQLSIDKTRRVLRLALVWAAEREFVAKAPLPEAEPAK